jgi:hypothetical protein
MNGNKQSIIIRFWFKLILVSFDYIGINSITIIFTFTWKFWFFDIYIIWLHFFSFFLFIFDLLLNFRNGVALD